MNEQLTEREEAMLAALRKFISTRERQAEERAAKLALRVTALESRLATAEQRIAALEARAQKPEAPSAKGSAKPFALLAGGNS